MPDFRRDSAADIVSTNPGIDMGTSGSMREVPYTSEELWLQADAHHRAHYASRPYALADRPYEHFEPAYRYGHLSAHHLRAREWHEVEGELEHGWPGARGASRSAWAEVKDAARDAWDHVRGHPHAPPPVVDRPTTG